MIPFGWPKGLLPKGTLSVCIGVLDYFWLKAGEALKQLGTALLHQLSACSIRHVKVSPATNLCDVLCCEELGQRVSYLF